VPRLSVSLVNEHCSGITDMIFMALSVAKFCKKKKNLP